LRQQFRIANGERLDLTEDPTPRAHAFELRINGEDPGRGFLPGPGPVRVYREPSGPGVRVDSGVESGSVIGGQFDSLLAKLIVTGENRTQALERARRALAEFEIEGLATLLPFHRHVVEHPAFIGSVADDGSETFGVYTKWIETEWENTLPPYIADAPIDGHGEPRQTITVEVDGRRVEVTLPGGLTIGSGIAHRPAQPNTAPPRWGPSDQPSPNHDTVIAPMQGTVVKIAVEEDQQVAPGDLIIVVEAMKMGNPVTAHKAGIVTGLAVQPGAAVNQGTPIAQLKQLPDPS
jgi:acetyl-CoA/propionyl-CoA carboxylase, biotin carboxylase, biotin carboxyl carrier protein